MPDATIGHNRRLPDVLKDIVDDMPEQVRAEFAPHLERTKELAANAATVPGTIANDAQEKLGTDILAQLGSHVKVIEAAREGMKAPVLQMGKIIDNVAKAEGQAPLEEQIKRINPGMTIYKRDKAERERRRLEEEARKQREEAERLQREAAEAERRKREAEQAAARAAEERRRQEEAAARAKEEERLARERQKVAEEAARKAEADRAAAAAMAEAERIRAAESTRKREREAAEARARKLEAEAIEADQRRIAEEKRAAEEAAAKAKAKEESERAKAAEAEARAQHQEAKSTVSDAGRDAKSAGNLARQADGDAYKADKAASVGDSKLSAQRGDYGGHSHLRTNFAGEFIDPRKVPPKTMKILWDLISSDDKQKAINKYVALHKDTLPLEGVRIYETSTNATRS